MDRRVFLGSGLGFAVAAPLLTTLEAHAQSGEADAAAYPSRPVRILIPFATGSSGDNLCRTLGDLLGDQLHQKFFVENPLGAGGLIGITTVARAKPDGYTLLFSTPSLIINPLLYASAKYDPFRDFEYVGMGWAQPAVFLVRKDSRFNTLQQAVSEAKSNPGKLTFGSAGIGTFNHLAGELFGYRAGVKFTHIPYKGIAPAIVDVLGGRIDFVFATVGVLVSNRDALKGLAVASASRSRAVPEVPTATEAGMPGWDYGSWGGIVAPAATPKAIMAKLSGAMATGLAQSSYIERFSRQGIDTQFMSSENFAANARREFEVASMLVKAIGLKVE